MRLEECCRFIMNISFGISLFKLRNSIRERDFYTLLCSAGGNICLFPQLTSIICGETPELS